MLKSEGKNRGKGSPKSYNNETSIENKIMYYEKRIFDLEQLLDISKALNSQIGFAKLIDSILYTIMAQLSTPDVAVFTRASFDDNDFVLNRCYYGFGFAIEEK